MPTSTDDQLVHDYLAGDVNAFEQLHDRYARRLLGFLRALGVEPHAADDLAQRAWCRAIERLTQYGGRGRYRSWLFTIAYRLWVDEIDRVGHQGPHSPIGAMAEQATADRSPLDTALDREQRDRVNRALRALPDPLRRTVLLRVDGGLKFRQIAEAMQCPLGTVLWRMRDARRRLASALEERPTRRSGARPSDAAGRRLALTESGSKGTAP